MSVVKSPRNCGNCRHWRPRADIAPSHDADGNEYAWGQCRVHPPRVIDAESERCPDTTADHDCGLWKPEPADTFDAVMLEMAEEVILGNRAAAHALADRLAELKQEEPPP